MDPVAVVSSAGGLATTAVLKAAGCSEYALTAAVRAGRMHRVRNGWYTILTHTAPRIVAVSSGGCLTGASALYEMGAWMLESPARIHVAVPAHSSARPADARVVLHWENPSGSPSQPGVAALGDALVRIALDESADVSVPCFDWALATGRLDRIDLERVLLRLPPSARLFADWIDQRSQSVLESVARVRLLSAGWAVKSQIRVGELESIDLVVEGQIALELDGREFHESTFERDRRKDLAIAIEGRHSIRISLPMLRHVWADVERAITAALAARRHGDGGKSGEPRVMPKRKLRARPGDGQLS
jgi:very-short-patch-repair endonuclease